MRKKLIFGCVFSAFFLLQGDVFAQKILKKLGASADVSKVSIDHGLNLVIVDKRKVASASKAGKSIEQQVADENNHSKKELGDLESKIKSMESNKTTRVDTEKIENLQLILYDMVNERKSKIAVAYEHAISELEKAIDGVIQGICEESKIDVVITAEAVVFKGANCEDITAETIKRLDQKCEYIKLVIDEK